MDPIFYDYSDMVSAQQDTNYKLDLIISRLDTLETCIVSGDSNICSNLEIINNNSNLLCFILAVLVLLYVCFDR